VIVARDDAPYHRFCVTHYRVLARGPRFALCELDASPAFRHQVRAHLASIGHPIAGDALYGGPAVAELGPRHALHASFLAHDGDALVPAFAVSDEAPSVFSRLVASDA
jgi:23S rRNA pseudouridine1911/1915/1917 synthase